MYDIVHSLWLAPPLFVALVGIGNLKRRIRDLELALTTKRALMGTERSFMGYHMHAGDTLILKSQNGVQLATVTVQAGDCTLDASITV